MHPLVEAARPRTLPAALAPVLVGTAAAASAPADLDGVRGGLALLVALSLQVAVNYANDLFDGLGGVDTADRTGPRRAVAAGLVSARRMAVAMSVALALAGLAGLALAWLVGWELLAVGAVAILAALGYSGGRRPYASRGLGEVSVFVFFGVVATVGAQYVQDGRVGATALAASVPVGLVAVAILLVNNLRDIPTDAATGKRTLAVRLGDAATRRLFVGSLGGGLLGTFLVAWAARSAWPLLGLIALPWAARAAAPVRRGAAGTALVAPLVATARFHLVLAVALAAGLLLAAV